MTGEGGTLALPTANPTLIHQGPGWLYLNVCAPATGKRHIIGSDGTPTIPAWQAATPYTAGTQIKANNTFIAECTTAGTTGASQPTWPQNLYDTVQDGTVVWTLVSHAPFYEFAGAQEGVTELDLGAKVEAVSAEQEA